MSEHVPLGPPREEDRNVRADVDHGELCKSEKAHDARVTVQKNKYVLIEVFIKTPIYDVGKCKIFIAL